MAAVPVCRLARRFWPRLSRYANHVQRLGLAPAYAGSRYSAPASGQQIRYSSGSDRRERVVVENGETIIRSPYPDVKHCDKTFGEFMFSFLDKYQDSELMVSNPTGQSYTGAQLKDAMVRVASKLHRLGYRKGDVVLLFATNCPEYAILFVACSAIGVTISTANPVYTAGELSRQLAHSESCAVFTLREMLPTVQEALAREPDVSPRFKDVVIFDGVADKCRPFDDFLQDDGKAFPENVDIDPGEAILTLPYSSGTTGLPKGVMLTHTNMVMNLIQGMNGQMVFREGEDTLLGLLPFYHIYGMMVMQFGCITQGVKLIVMPKFEPETFLTALEKHKITYAHLVPPIALFLAKHPSIDNYCLKNLRTIVCAAAPLGAGMSQQVEERLGVSLLQAYGLTETSPIVAYDETPARQGTIGTLIPSTLAKVIDPMTGVTLPIGESGELMIKGPQVMKGYLKNEEATNNTIKDGWLYTGDIGHADEDGYFTISDRIKELIKYKGNQVAPAELEAVLCTHPSIQDAAVIGLDAGELGEVPKAFIVTKPGETIGADDVTGFVEKNVAPYKRLRGGVEFINEIPKTASGKILRRMLKDKA